MWQQPNNVIEIKSLHSQGHVFIDHRVASKQLARLLTKWRDSNAVVLAIPAGGVPVVAGLASDFIMQVAIESLRNQQPGYIIVAFPTGHSSSVKRIAEDNDQRYCPDIREGYRYAVTNAFDNWYDVSEKEVTKLLQQSAT